MPPHWAGAGGVVAHDSFNFLSEVVELVVRELLGGGLDAVLEGGNSDIRGKRGTAADGIEHVLHQEPRQGIGSVPPSGLADYLVLFLRTVISVQDQDYRPASLFGPLDGPGADP